MSKYQDGEKLSWLSEKMISIFTDIDPHSLTPFEETVIQGLIIVILMLSVLIFQLGGRS